MLKYLVIYCGVGIHFVDPPSVGILRETISRLSIFFIVAQITIWAVIDRFPMDPFSCVDGTCVTPKLYS